MPSDSWHRWRRPSASLRWEMDRSANNLWWSSPDRLGNRRKFRHLDGGVRQLSLGVTRKKSIPRGRTARKWPSILATSRIFNRSATTAYAVGCMSAEKRHIRGISWWNARAAAHLHFCNHRVRRTVPSWCRSPRRFAISPPSAHMRRRGKPVRPGIPLLCDDGKSQARWSSAPTLGLSVMGPRDHYLEWKVVRSGLKNRSPSISCRSRCGPFSEPPTFRQYFSDHLESCA